MRGRVLHWFNRDARSWGPHPEDYDPEAVARTLEQVGRLFGPDRYFGLEVEGWQHLPPAPTLLVSNHSGGTTIPDVWGFGVAWYRHNGVRRPLHVLAHDIILATATTRGFFGRRGVLRGSRRLAGEVLSRYQRDLLVMPGGDLDTWRPYAKRYQVRFGGRIGYARLALTAGVPIVPVAHAGAHETLIVLSDGRGLARTLHLPELFRASIWPIHLSLPWGLAVGPWPHIPVPARLRYRIGPPIEAREPSPDPSTDAVAELDLRVRAALQKLLDELRVADQQHREHERQRARRAR